MRSHIRRREFITLLGGAAAPWPLAARAQQGGATKRVGVITSLLEQDPYTQARLAAFRQGLERRGWVDGRNVRIDYRFAPAVGSDETQRIANELVASQPDVIFSHGTRNSAALHARPARCRSYSSVCPTRSALASSQACRGQVAI